MAAMVSRKPSPCTPSAPNCAMSAQAMISLLLIQASPCARQIRCANARAIPSWLLPSPPTHRPCVLPRTGCDGRSPARGGGQRGRDHLLECQRLTLAPGVGKQLFPQTAPRGGHVLLVVVREGGADRFTQGRHPGQQGDRAREVSCLQSDAGDVVERFDGPGAITQPVEEAEALVEEGRGPLVVSLLDRQVTEVVEGAGDTALIPQLPLQRQAFFEVGDRRFREPQVEGGAAEIVQQHGDEVLMLQAS